MDQRPCKVGWVAILYNYQQSMEDISKHRKFHYSRLVSQYVPNGAKRQKTPKLRSMQCNTPFLLTGWQILQCSRCVCMICIAILHSRQRLLGWSAQVKCRSSNVLLHWLNGLCISNLAVTLSKISDHEANDFQKAAQFSEPDEQHSLRLRREDVKLSLSRLWPRS